MSSRRYNFNLNDETADVLRKHAKQSGVNMTEMINRMIQFYDETEMLRDGSSEVVLRNKLDGTETKVLIVNV